MFIISCVIPKVIAQSTNWIAYFQIVHKTRYILHNTKLSHIHVNLFIRLLKESI